MNQVADISFAELFFVFTFHQKEFYQINRTVGQAFFPSSVPSSSPSVLLLKGLIGHPNEWASIDPKLKWFAAGYGVPACHLRLDDAELYPRPPATSNRCDQ